MRAPNGAGHFDKVTLANGEERWYYERDFGKGPDGKRLRPQFSGRSMAEVIQKATQFEKDLAHGRPLRPERITVGEYLRRWLEENPGRCSESTIQGYEQKVRIYLEPNIGHIELSKLHRANVVSLYSSLEKAGVGERTLQYTHAVLRKALNDAVAHFGLLEQNPADKIKVARPQPHERNVIPPERIGEIAQAMQDDWLFPYYYLSLLTGCRRGELCGLRWPDVDLSSAIPSLEIRRSMAQLRKDLGGKRLKKPKTYASHRSVGLPPEAVNVLKEHRQKQARMRLKNGSPLNAQDMVFTGPSGEPLSPSTATQHWARIRGALGLGNVRLHDLRHTHATLLLQLGVPMKVVQKRLGHKNIAVTMDIYSHVTDSMEVDMLKRLSAATATATTLPELH